MLSLLAPADISVTGSSRPAVKGAPRIEEPQRSQGEVRFEVPDDMIPASHVARTLGAEWFRPDGRAGERQRVCSPECRRERRRRQAKRRDSPCLGSTDAASPSAMDPTAIPPTVEGRREIDFSNGKNAHAGKVRLQPGQILEVRGINDVSAASGGSHHDGIDRRRRRHRSQGLPSRFRKDLIDRVHVERRQYVLGEVGSATPPFDDDGRRNRDAHVVPNGCREHSANPLMPSFEANERTRIERQASHSARIFSASSGETRASRPNRSRSRSRASRWRRSLVASARTAERLPPRVFACRRNHLRSPSSTEMLTFCALLMSGM